jgi:hypothetical protein
MFHVAMRRVLTTGVSLVVLASSFVFLAASPASAVGSTSQTINFTSSAPTNAIVGGATYTPAASSTSSLTVVITVDSTSTSVCSISGSLVFFNASGTCTLDANQAGDTTYAVATQVQQSFTVRNPQTIAFTSTAPASAGVGGTTYPQSTARVK